MTLEILFRALWATSLILTLFFWVLVVGVHVANQRRFIQLEIDRAFVLVGLWATATAMGCFTAWLIQ